MNAVTKEEMEELFGSDHEDSEDSSNGDPEYENHFGHSPPARLTCEKLTGIPGLRLLRQGLPHSIQTSLLNTIIRANYFHNATTNQAMHFGDLPAPFAEIGTWAKDNTDLLDDIDRSPLFDQAILNLYRPGKDLMNT